MRILAITLVVFFARAKASGQNIPTATNFWNSKGRFAGSATCAGCHAAQAEKFRGSSMSRALEPIGRSAIPQGDAPYIFHDGPYTWSVGRTGGPTGGKVMYKITNGKETLEVPLEYAFGQGKAGQTYVFSMGGEYFESRVSYYASLHGLDLTVGAMNSAPTSLQDAAGRVMKGNEPRNCFGCHTTGARVGSTLQLTAYEDGVQCEGCHGPGGAHVDAVRQGKAAPGSIRALRGMTPQESNEFCGACHRTWEAVMTMGIRGINNSRFPAYRLTNSPCFSLEDVRISCTSCHDPHGALVTEDRAYDAKCTACHHAANVSLKKKTCPVGKHACTSCHMARVEPAESHHAFPDHWFRVVKKAEYPD
jgi:hypothetical protein